MGTSMDVTRVSEINVVESKFEKLRYLKLLVQDEDSKLSDKYDTLIKDFVKSDCENDRKEFDEIFYNSEIEVCDGERLVIYKDNPYVVTRKNLTYTNSGFKLQYPDWIEAVGKTLFTSAILYAVSGLIFAFGFKWITWKALLGLFAVGSSIISKYIHKWEIEEFEGKLIPLNKSHYDNLIKYINYKLDSKIEVIKNKYNLTDETV